MKIIFKKVIVSLLCLSFLSNNTAYASEYIMHNGKQLLPDKSTNSYYISSYCSSDALIPIYNAVSTQKMNRALKLKNL